ncbi:glutamine amidotransferase [Azotobacter beijerinckii]|uniref:GMP synthase (Glutamine-hydrolysing) n=1 Tax=Azotobacter beijerinckii TaxID=170623 RepID=A0A1I4DBS2_9GAMM|nr:glutamine amidotransferase [Azotobacter beijerinckii]SFB36018.1 GMP synthase (glutamine-hydrolysing) [Azotobacter beijerinckii]SFK90220.1 GMP synthase (glutamine-hydrolysing) [Azotobacter beijerinckii]
MKTVIAIRHVAFEDLGVFAPVLEELGYQIRYADPGILDAGELAALDVEAADLLVVLGAPIGACDESTYPFLLAELELLARRLRSGKPLLGICLGAQLIARVLGAKVAPMGVKEIGFGSLRLTAEGAAGCLGRLGDHGSVLHWHSDMFELPPGATLLARTEICPNQAFMLGKAVLGLQFHLEADPARIEQWLIGHAAELSASGINPVAIRQQAKEVGAELRQRGQQVLRDWLAGLA